MVGLIHPRAEGELEKDVLEYVTDAYDDEKYGATMTLRPHLSTSADEVRGHLSNGVSANLIVFPDNPAKIFGQLPLVNAAKALLVPFVYVDSQKLAEAVQNFGDNLFVCAVVNKHEDIPPDFMSAVNELCYPHLYEYI